MNTGSHENHRFCDGRGAPFTLCCAPMVRMAPGFPIRGNVLTLVEAIFVSKESKGCIGEVVGISMSCFDCNGNVALDVVHDMTKTPHVPLECFELWLVSRQAALCWIQ